MITVISFLIVIGVLVFIHELGHFAVAKFSGVKVETFSLGFGPKILSVKRGDTEYCLSLIPFGGYVKMLGGETGEEEVSDEEKEKAFPNKPLLHRTLIVAAGSVMNLLLALVLFPVIFMIGIDVPAYLDREARVEYLSKDGLAFGAGFKNGDVIEELNGKAVETWEGYYEALSFNRGKEIKFKVRRGKEYFTAAFAAQTPDSANFGYAGIYPPMAAVVGDVQKGSSAEKTGLKKGDSIKAIGGVTVSHWMELQETVRKNGSELKFLIERKGDSFEAKITPLYNKELNVYLIGVTQKEETVKRSFGFFEAIGLGLKRAWDLTVLFFEVIKGLITGLYSIKTLGGPIMIAQVAGKAAETGIVSFLSIIAFLSLQLGVINLLPFPVLDGGHLLFFLVERIRGKPLSEKVLKITQQAGLVLIVTLMLLVTWNDILRVLGKLN